MNEDMPLDPFVEEGQESDRFVMPPIPACEDGETCPYANRFERNKALYVTTEIATISMLRTIAVLAAHGDNLGADHIYSATMHLIDAVNMYLKGAAFYEEADRRFNEGTLW